MTKLKCSKCKEPIIREPESCGTGYAHDGKGKKICYKCCAIQDTEYMTANNKIMLYLDEKKRAVTNWPGTLIIPFHHIKEGRHNIAGTRHDVWFKFAGKEWHGVQYGDMSDLVHCKALKAA